MDKVASLKAFVKVVETGSFSEAGRQLRLSRSAISKYVARSRAKVSACNSSIAPHDTRVPTENGQLYFERALGILSELDAADQAVDAFAVDAARAPAHQCADVVRHDKAGAGARGLHAASTRRCSSSLC